MKRTTLEAIVALSTIACKDDSRPHISGVHIEQIGAKVRLQATNGHMAAIQFVEDQLPLGCYFMANDQVSAAKLVLRETRNISEFDCNIDSEKALIYGPFTKGRIQKDHSNYPDVSAVIPRHGHQAAITLNAEYILALAKIAQKARCGFSPNYKARIVFDPSDSKKPAFIESEGVSDLQMVVMPIRDGGAESLADALAEKLCPISDDSVISLPKGSEVAHANS